MNYNELQEGDKFQFPFDKNLHIVYQKITKQSSSKFNRSLEYLLRINTYDGPCFWLESVPKTWLKKQNVNRI